LRVIFSGVLIVIITLLLISSPVGSPSGDILSPGTTAPSADGVTVITTQDAGREQLETAEIVAFHPNGSILYYDDSKGTYFDVDPVPDRTYNVSYVATEFVSKSDCPAAERCVRNQLIETNLSTGESTVLYERLRMDTGDSRWHDADRINETHYAIADLSSVDRVYIVNISSGITTWSWNAQAHFDLRSGEGFVYSWSHINDVEVVDDGRIMVSMRNQDQVVFINRSTGVQESWTIGSENKYEILHEQHNPDYIPRSAGGPAVIVADSENDRIVEYQRKGKSWEHSWSYTDGEMRWPRDGDRLPNGHTLITDSNGDRVIEVDTDGNVVWSVDVALPYEAERLSTPEESDGGPSADLLGLSSYAGADASEGGQGGSRSIAQKILDFFVPDPVAGALFFIAPSWVGAFDLILFGVLIGVLILWVAFELYAAGVRISLSSPIQIRRRE